MPHDAVAIANPDVPLATRRSRRLGLRLAFAISVGFTIAVAMGSPLAFLPPMLAMQFIMASPRPLPLNAAVGMFVIVLVVSGALMFCVSLFGDRPPVLITVLGLLYFVCFAAQAQSKALPVVGLVMTISTVTLILGMANVDLGQAVVTVLLLSLGGGLLVAWAAHALFPSPDAVGAEPIATPFVVPHPLRRAAANTAILLGAIVLCFIHASFTTAIIVPLTVTSLINQANIAVDQRAIWGLLAVNLIGGILASFAFSLLSLQPDLVFLFLILLTVGLFFGGRAGDPASGKVFAGSLAIFLILFGLGVSPIPTTAPESFQTRIVMVLFSIAYTIMGIGLLWNPAGLHPSPADDPPKR